MKAGKTDAAAPSLPGVNSRPGSRGARFQCVGVSRSPEAALDMVLSVDDPESRLNALREVMETAIKFGYGHDFLPLLSATIMSLTSYRELHDEILRMLASVLASVNISSNYLNSNIDFESRIVLLNDILISLGMEKKNISLPRYSLGKIDDPDESACMFNAINDMIEKIKDPQIRAKTLADVEIGRAHV